MKTSAQEDPVRSQFLEPTKPKKYFKILQLPTELQLQVFRFLSLSELTFLGLTCKTLYTIHKDVRHEKSGHVCGEHYLLSNWTSERRRWREEQVQKRQRMIETHARQNEKWLAARNRDTAEMDSWSLIADPHVWRVNAQRHKEYVELKKTRVVC